MSIVQGKRLGANGFLFEKVIFQKKRDSYSETDDEAEKGTEET